MKKSPNILNEAISKLPSKKAPDHCWEEISAYLDDQVLKEAIIDMEIKRAPEEPWEKIQSALEENDPLARAIADLPQRKLVNDNFDRLMEPEINNTRGFKRWLGIAASFLLITSLYWIYNQPTNGLEYSEEIASELPQLPDNAKGLEGDEVLMFITENCAIDEIRCKSPEFTGLFDLYLQLTATQKELEIEIAQNQQFTSLMTFLVETEKEKTEIGKQLIYLIMS